ncbi:glycerophosphoryl diester phosphodiesterase [Thalassotalea profundi]|uniref:Glycerophosphoryl diester phosphodiesterase n=1 Tax=Thalassotalea profundi TaxID=2036687 RepID=A0ABQ3ISA1_9GAMM|nr:glycerophosphoryl diester phosphodiesterase [Thalassotalea profundi]
MLIIAHRGASGEYPENSTLAIKKAIEQGADGIEIDIQHHRASGEFIVFHDRDLSRLTSKLGTINNFTLDELLQTTIGQEQTIITLEQAIALIPEDILLNIELKISASEQSIIDLVIKKLERVLRNAVSHNKIKWSQLYISSFNHYLIQSGSLVLPKVQFAALIAHCPLNYAQFSEKMQLSGVNQDIDCLNQELVNDIHQRGLSCWVYTVDNIDDIEKCLLYKVDAIFTNFPQQTRDKVNTICH